jgi:hypothetical protein
MALRQPAARLVVPAVINPARSMADATMPTISIAHPWIVGPFNNHNAADDRTRTIKHGSIDIHNAPDHRATHNMAVNDHVPVVSTPAIPMAGLHRGGLGEGAKEDRA